MIKFNVGDRVRATADAPEGKIGVITEDDGIEPRYLVRFDDWRGGHGGKNNEWWLYSKELESAPLTIVAGRYYKTRDGRKVGPMQRYGKEWVAKYEGGKRWFNDGRRWSHNNHHDDFIAEWPTETAKRGNPAATVDAIADEYGGAKSGGPKFKAGDRVRVVKVAPAIVALIENGQPKPADRPFVHPDRAAASKEAARLAGKHKGKEFGVYEFVSSVSVTPDHEWQRLAANGDKDGAIDRLIADAGISRMDAHSAVRRFAA